MQACPTPLHAAAADSVVVFFAHRPEPGAVLLATSCARGKAPPESDIQVGKAEDSNRLWKEYIPAGEPSSEGNTMASSPDGSPVRDHTARV